MTDEPGFKDSKIPFAITKKALEIDMTGFTIEKFNQYMDKRKPGSLLSTKNKGRPDNFQTPEWPVVSLLNELDFATNTTIWDPACGKGNIVRACTKKEDLGAYDFILNSFGTDLETGHDFLAYDQSTMPEFDVIVTNPPYSIKDQFIAKCYELGKPWAMLMPLTALEGKKRLALYREHGLQLILLPRRVNFETPSGKGSGSHFATAWFTWGFNLPRDITYA